MAAGEDRSGRPHVVNLPDLAKLEPSRDTLAENGLYGRIRELVCAKSAP